MADDAPLKLDRMLAHAVQGLRISPLDFWRLGMREWLHLVTGESASRNPPGRADLERLMARYPDRQHYQE